MAQVLVIEGGEEEELPLTGIVIRPSLLAGMVEEGRGAQVLEGAVL